MMQFLMRVVDAKRKFLGGDVVAQDEIQLIVLSAPASDGRDGVVRLSVRLREDEHALVAVAAPVVQHPLGQVDHPFRVRAAQAQYRHRPADDPRPDIREVAEAVFFLRLRPRHGELIVAALEVIVAQDRPAHDGQVRVGADKVVRELSQEAEELLKGCPVDLHRGVAAVKHDAVFVVVDIRGILEEPVLARNRNRDQPVIGASRVIQASCVALVFRAEQAFRIVGLRQELRGSDGTRVLFGLGKVDGDIQRAIGAVVDPLPVPRDSVPADIIGVTAEGIKPFGRGKRAFLPFFRKGFPHLMRHRHHGVHQQTVKKIGRYDTLGNHTALHGRINQHLQQYRQRSIQRFFPFIRGVHLQNLQQTVVAVGSITGFDQPLLFCVVQQPEQGGIDIHTHFSTSSSTPPTGRIDSRWQLFAPSRRSISAQNASTRFSGTIAWIVPANPPP